jgi:hypothetical protein
MHSHPQGIVYYLADATWRVTLPDGTTSESKVANGQVAWREFTRHAVENTGRTDAHAIAVELKSTTEIAPGSYVRRRIAGSERATARRADHGSESARPRGTGLLASRAVPVAEQVSALRQRIHGLTVESPNRIRPDGGDH